MPELSIIAIFFVPKLIVYSLLCRIALRDVLGESGALWSKAVGFSLIRIFSGMVLMFPAGLFFLFSNKGIGGWMSLAWPLMLPLRWLAWRVTMQFMRHRFNFAGFLLPRSNRDLIWTVVAVLASCSLDVLTFLIWPESNSKMAC